MSAQYPREPVPALLVALREGVRVAALVLEASAMHHRHEGLLRRRTRRYVLEVEARRPADADRDHDLAHVGRKNEKLLGRRSVCGGCA